MDHEALVELIGRQALQAGGVEAAVRLISKLGVGEEAIQRAVDDYRRRVANIRYMKVVTGLEDPGLPAPWYAGPQPDDVFWPELKRVLHEERGLSRAVVSMVDEASSSVVGRLSPPHRTDFNVRGLVVGHVQSGKTTNFTSVVAKAADIGYRLFIILSGITDGLRLQTQRRIEADLISRNPKAWYNLTQNGDFVGPGNATNLLGNTDHRLIAVVKKNSSRLRRLNKWLKSASDSVIRDLPILVIDDEADQASIDVGRDEDRSTINQLILDLLERPRVAYVGYTATPFANFLIDPSYPNDLYPRDFIINLPKPANHYGTASIFGREPLSHDEHGAETDGFDMVRHVPPEELPDLKPPSSREKWEAWTPRITPSLAEATRYFVMATAARRVRGSQDPMHSTMLVHTTQLSSPQLSFQKPLERLLEQYAQLISDEDPAFMAELEGQWHREQSRMPSDLFEEVPVGFSQLSQELLPTVRSTRVLVDNYLSKDALDFAEDGGIQIVVGGNKLSRGLTLEGLLVSFFVRATSFYDTLLQMGRWFGFRDGYADLPRLWLTPELHNWFIHLATVEQEIRYEIQRYEAEHVKPTDVPVLIRTHPKLNITSAAKMRHAVRAHMSFERRRLQTILFHHRDADWLASNLNATHNLIRGAAFDGKPAEDIGHGRWLIQDVDASRVISFINDYSFHEASYDLKADLLEKYIAEQNGFDELKQWNIVIMGLPRAPERRELDLGIGRPVVLINRSRIRTGAEYANIKALMSRKDIVADLGLDPSSIGDGFDQLIDLRPPGKGLLLVYPIDKTSQPGAPRGGKLQREALDAVEDVIGIALVFPKALHSTPQAYVSADLSSVEHEEVEVPEDEDLGDDVPLDPGAAN